MGSNSTFIFFFKTVILSILLKNNHLTVGETLHLKSFPGTQKVSPSPAYLNCFHVIQTSVDKDISIIIYYLFLLLLRSVAEKLCVQVAEF